MDTKLHEMANFGFHPESGRLIAATRAAESENQANKTFLREATARFGAETNVSPEMPITLQH